ncbi:MAG: phosphate/phosphite/phosphonate ABC transporter substrate-binding protein [Anaerolineae bacterium]
MSRKFLLALLVGILLLSACARPAYRRVSLTAPEAATTLPTAPPGSPALRVAVAAILSPQSTLPLYDRLAEYLADRLDRPVELVQRATYAETNELLRTGQVDLAFICTGAYVRGQQEFGMDLLAVPQVGGKTTYQSYLIVPAESPARRWEDLRGGVFAFTDPLSLSGYLAVLALLRSAGENPEAFFARTLFTYSHDHSVRAVAEGWVDGAAVDSLVYEALREREPLYRERTRVVWESEPFGAPPVVAPLGIDPNLRAQLRQVLLEMDRTPEGREVLGLLGVDRFVPGDDRLYDSARETMRAAGGPK